jgi:hypothetical protein
MMAQRRRASGSNHFPYSILNRKFRARRRPATLVVSRIPAVAHGGTWTGFRTAIGRRARPTPTAPLFRTGEMIIVQTAHADHVPGLAVMLIGTVLIFDLVVGHKGADHDSRNNVDRDHHSCSNGAIASS